MTGAQAQSPVRMLHLDIHRHHKPPSHEVIRKPSRRSGGKVKVPSEIAETTQKSTEKLKTRAGNKRDSSGLIQFPPEKRQKQTQEMNRSVSGQCSVLLKSLMGHRKSWPFIEPMDPERWNIPKPMDLGTIKANLEKSLYVDIDAFAEDIRLTFSNVVSCYPPHNYVHKVAVEMRELFENRWKSLEEKWKCQFESQEFSRKQSDKNSAVKQNDPGSSMLGAALPKRAEISEKTVETTSSFNPKTAPLKVAKPEKKSGSKPSDQSSHKGTDDGKIDRHKRGSIRKRPLIHQSNDSSYTSNDSGFTVAADNSMSPCKVLRAAMIKSRYADTILKAQEGKLLTSEASSQREVFLKRQRQEEREAARVALEKMQNHANLEENLDVTAELENLCGCSMAYSVSFCHEWSCDEPTWRSCHGSPIELLGLFLKEDYAIDEEEDKEEGRLKQ